MTTYADAIARPPPTLTEREQLLLLQTSGLHRDGFRDHVIYSIALGCALREHEIVALDVGGVFDEAGNARRRVTLQVFKRSSTNPPPQEVLLPKTLRAKLEKLYKLKRMNDESLAPDAPLFVSRKGNRLSCRQVRHAFGEWQKRAGFDRRFTVHALRHTALTNLYRRTKDIRLTQRAARHASILSTCIYTHPSDEDLVRAMDEQRC